MGRNEERPSRRNFHRHSCSSLSSISLVIGGRSGRGVSEELYITTQQCRRWRTVIRRQCSPVTVSVTTRRVGFYWTDVYGHSRPLWDATYEYRPIRWTRGSIGTKKKSHLYIYRRETFRQFRNFLFLHRFLLAVC